MSETLEASSWWLVWGFILSLLAGYVVGILLSERYFERVCRRCQAKQVRSVPSGRPFTFVVLLVALLYVTVLVFTDTAFSRGWLMRAATVLVGVGAGALAAYAGCAHDAWADCVLCHQTGKPAAPASEGDEP